MHSWLSECVSNIKCWNCDNITYLSSSKHSTQCFIVAPRYCLEIGQRHEYNCTKFIEINHICLKLATNKASCFVAVKETGLILIRVYNHSPFPFIFTNIMMTPSNGNVFRFTGPLWGESTGPRWFPLTRPVTRNSDVFFDLCLNKRLSKQSRRRLFGTPSQSLWRHCFLNPLTKRMLHWHFTKIAGEHNEHSKLM